MCAGLVSRNVLEEALEARTTGAVARDSVGASVQLRQARLFLGGAEVVIAGHQDAEMEPGGDDGPRQALVELSLGEGVAGVVDGDAVVGNLLCPGARLVDGVGLVTVRVVDGEDFLVL
ncbi:hypothetical protein I4F81_007881 [Pyropia yezoensis]|uniref:Uncharacterized protein n=1 Tax=Pyropia yezoensis TaxID=2788 RepID=A0ACC3C646_PYRYE|nr:hypothetical protein I4F81_007881 [Neopyropia yezoensis]